MEAVVMTPTENYFFDHNIQVWSTKTTSKYVYYSTDDGQYVATQLGQLYREQNDQCERVV